MEEKEKVQKRGNNKGEEESILKIANRVNKRAEEGKQKDKRYNSFAG